MTQINKDYKEILTKGGSALAIRIMGFLAGYLFIYFTVFYFGAETQGRLSLSFSIMILSSLLCRLGADIHFVKLFAIQGKYDDARGLYFKTVPLFFIISGMMSVIIFLLAGVISDYVFQDPELKPYLQWTAPCIMLFTFILLNAAVFRGLKKNSLYAFLFNGGRFLFSILVFGLLLLLFSKDPLQPIIAHTTAIFILFLISVIYIRKLIYPRTTQTDYGTRSFLRGSFPMLLSASMIVFLGWLDTFILGMFRGSADVGVYNVVLKIAAVISFSMIASDSILAPKLSKAYYDDDLPLFKKLVTFTTMINAGVSIVIIAGILLFKDFILGLFGEEFQLATTTLIILCSGQLINAIFGPVGSIFQMTGHQRVWQNILLVSVIINITLNVLLAKEYGMNGVAVATAFSLVFSKLVSVFYIKRLVWQTGREQE